jgi:hypothetical protein
MVMPWGAGGGLQAPWIGVRLKLTEPRFPQSAARAEGAKTATADAASRNVDRRIDFIA